MRNFFRGARIVLSGGVLGVITNHTSQFSILSSQFSILNFQSSIFNLLGVAGAAGATQFLLNHKCHATREGEAASAAGKGQHELMVAERAEDLRLPCLGFDATGQDACGTQENALPLHRNSIRTGVLILCGRRKQ